MVSGWLKVKAKAALKYPSRGTEICQKKKVGLGRIALNFTSSLPQEYSGRVDLKSIIQRGLHLPHLWKTELQLQLFLGDN